MKLKLHFIILAFVVSVSVLAQQTPPRLIIRGDDMGFSHAGNEALIKAYKEGVETSIEVIVASPWFPEAVKLLAENPGIDVGVHLAITSEWDNIKWRPLTDCPSLKDADGYFYPMIQPNKNYPGQSIKEHTWKLEDIEKEFRAQIEMAVKKIPRISHVSGHMGSTGFDEAVRTMTKKLCEEYHIYIDMESLGVKNTSYSGPHKTEEEKLTSFMAMLDKLESGKTYVFVDHPGLDSPELRAIHHIGYEEVASDRQGVTALWTNPQIKEVIRKKGIQLISYRDLKK